MKEAARRPASALAASGRAQGPAAPEYLKDVLRFAYGSGWRRGEIVRLRWDMADRAAGTLTLPDSKNTRGRVLPLTGELADVIKRREAARLITRGEQVVVTDLIFHRDGKPVGDTRKAWSTACIKAGLYHVEKHPNGTESKVPDKLFHDFRRSAIRNMVRSGVRETVAMAISGHATASVFRRYDITSGDDLRDAMEQRSAYEQSLVDGGQHERP